MNLKLLTVRTELNPERHSVRPMGREKPTGCRADEFLPSLLGMMDCPLQILFQDQTHLHEMFDIIRDMQTYLLILFHCRLALLRHSGESIGHLLQSMIIYQ